MNVVIRKAAHADLDAITALMAELDEAHQHLELHLLHQGAAKPLDREKFAAMFEAEDVETLVAVVNGEVAGFGRVQFIDRTENRIFKAHRLATVHELAVTTDYRNLGIGEKLMQAIHDEAHKQKVDRVTISHFAGNEGAGRFYERLGYTPFIRSLNLTLNIDEQDE